MVVNCVWIYLQFLCSRLVSVIRVIYEALNQAIALANKIKEGKSVC